MHKTPVLCVFLRPHEKPVFQYDVYFVQKIAIILEGIITINVEYRYTFFNKHHICAFLRDSMKLDKLAKASLLPLRKGQ